MNSRWKRIEDGIATRDGRYVVDLIIDGLRIRRSAKPNTIDAARSLREQILKQHCEANAQRTAKSIFQSQDENWIAIVDKIRSSGGLRKKFLDLRRSARQRGISFSLTERQLDDLIVQSNGRCSLTGIALEFGSNPRHPFKLSIDRIKPNVGYQFDNLRVVCFSVNVAIGEWGQEVLAAIALGYVREAMAQLENNIATAIGIGVATKFATAQGKSATNHGHIKTAV